VDSLEADTGELDRLLFTTASLRRKKSPGEQSAELAARQSIAIINYSPIIAHQPANVISPTGSESFSGAQGADQLQMLVPASRPRLGFSRLGSYAARGNSVETHRSKFSIDPADCTSLAGPADSGQMVDKAVLALIEQLIGACPEADLIHFARQADGDPLLIGDLIVGLLAEGQLDVSGTTARLRSAALPERLITGVRQRLGGLTSLCRQFVTVAAILAEEVTLGDVAHMLGETPARLLPELEEAISHRVLVVRDESMTFASELLWLAIRRTVPVPVANALRDQAQRLPHSGEFAPPSAPVPERKIGAETGRHDTGPTELNAAESDIVRLVGEGMTNAQIARSLAISPHTVSYHLRKIYRRLNVASRAGMVSLVGHHR
jgi:DNA-binding CsgD family transcriptional regulator